MWGKKSKSFTTETMRLKHLKLEEFYFFSKLLCYVILFTFPNAKFSKGDEDIAKDALTTQSDQTFQAI